MVRLDAPSSSQKAEFLEEVEEANVEAASRPDEDPALPGTPCPAQSLNYRFYVVPGAIQNSCENSVLCLTAPRLQYVSHKAAVIRRDWGR